MNKFEEYNLIKNNSRAYKNGTVWRNGKCGEFEIIGKTDRMYIQNGRPVYNYFLCKFEDGTVVESNSNSIYYGTVKNYNYPTVWGVGWIGYGEFVCYKNKCITKEYKDWNEMLRRCYDPKQLNRRMSYINTHVDKKWFNFQNFAKWAVSQNGISEKGWCLDKDLLGSGNMYSEDVCCYIPKYLNSLITSSKNINKTHIKPYLDRLKNDLNKSLYEKLLNKYNFL